MAGTSHTLVRHPVEATVTGIGDRLKDVRDVPLWSMDAAATRQVLVDLAPVKAQLAELEARVLAHGRTIEVEAASGATSTANWWAHETRQTRACAHRVARLATALAKDRHEPVRLALADGELLVEQAEVIIDAIDALPDDLDPDITPAPTTPLMCRPSSPKERSGSTGGPDPPRPREILDHGAA